MKLIRRIVHWLQTREQSFMTASNTAVVRSEKNSNVWIGCGDQVMPDVTIADGCVIGAGTGVTRNTEPYGVYGGVPAKLIKHWKNKLEENK